MEVNEEAINNYFSKLDVEIYYGNDQSYKPIIFLRKLYEDISSNKTKLF